jgi:integrase
MASIYKRGNHRNFYAALSGADGRRIYRSTKTPVKREAQAMAVKWEQEQEKLRKTNTKPQRKVAEIVSRIANSAEEGNLTESKARKALTEIFYIFSNRELKLYSVREWMAEWGEMKAQNEPLSTSLNRNRSIAHILDALKKTADKRIDLVTTEELETAKTWLAKQKTRSGSQVRKSTQNIKLSHLRAAFREAFERGHIPRNVGAPIKNFPEDDSEIVSGFTHAELGKLCAAASGEWKDAIILAAHTGLRRENILRLKWAEVAHEQNELHVQLVKQKVGSKKIATIPLTSDAFKVVMRHQGQNPTYVFPELSNLRHSAPNYQFDRIMKEAGVPKKTVISGGIEVKRTFHSLRHTFTSLLANQNVAAEVRQELTGHASDKAHQIYTHLDTQTLRDAINTLPSLTSE